MAAASLRFSARLCVLCAKKRANSRAKSSKASQVGRGAPSTTPLRVAVPLPVPGRSEFIARVDLLVAGLFRARDGRVGRRGGGGRGGREGFRSDNGCVRTRAGRFGWRGVGSRDRLSRGAARLAALPARAGRRRFGRGPAPGVVDQGVGRGGRADPRPAPLSL